MTDTEESGNAEAHAFHAGTFMSLISAASFHALEAAAVCPCDNGKECFWLVQHQAMQGLLEYGTAMIANGMTEPPQRAN